MGSRARRDWFSRPENDSRIKSTWERFLSGEDRRSDALRCLIDDSWRRCQSDRVDPLQGQAEPPVDDGRLEGLRKRHSRLIDASMPLMAQARDFLAQTGTVMILADPGGTILDLEGDPRMHDPLENIHLLPGCNWTESAIGTNAIGTALALGQPVQIHAAEHYCEGIQRWTCSATTIRDPLDSSILGVIDVSGLSRHYSRHSLALAITTAGRIESRLSRLEMERRFSLLEHCVERLSPTSPDGVVVFDRRGHLLKTNGRAADALVALAVRIELHAGTRIAALNFEEPETERPALPEWMRPEWVEPILEGREIIGSVVSIPMAVGRSISLARFADTEALPSKGFERIVGRSAPLLEALQRARHLARSNVPVLLLGETGVGKELFARGIHDGGERADAPFVALNCGGLSRELLASELFGYAEGAFTGARRGGMKGKIEAADGGTLFLDEIGEMPLDLQPHLLRVLEEGEIYRVGETAPRKVDFRLIAATNRDLRGEVSEGRFRMDLFYRIAVTSIRIPALRDRLEDVPVIVADMIEVLAARHGLPVPALEPALLDALARYEWPGNVRELRNVVEFMLLMGTQGCLQLADLPPEIRDAGEAAPPVACAETLEGAEQAQIRNAIRNSRGNLTEAARTLRIAKSTLYLKVRKYEMEPLLQDARVGPG